MGLSPVMALMVPMAPAAPAASGKFVTSWTTVWSALSTFSFLTKTLIFIGTLLIVWALVKMIMAKVRNRPMDTKQLVWALVIGAFLVFPNEIIKAILGVADSAVIAIKSLLGAVFKP